MTAPRYSGLWSVWSWKRPSHCVDVEWPYLDLLGSGSLLVSWSWDCNLRFGSTLNEYSCIFWTLIGVWPNPSKLTVTLDRKLNDYTSIFWTLMGVTIPQTLTVSRVERSNRRNVFSMSMSGLHPIRILKKLVSYMKQKLNFYWMFCVLLQRGAYKNESRFFPIKGIFLTIPDTWSYSRV
jgi:hypothetical protein